MVMVKQEYQGKGVGKGLINLVRDKVRSLVPDRKWRTTAKSPSYCTRAELRDLLVSCPSLKAAATLSAASSSLLAAMSSTGVFEHAYYIGSYMGGILYGMSVSGSLHHVE